MAPIPTLKQGTLSFASTKRTASASNAKAKKHSRTASSVTRRAASFDSISVPSSRSDIDVDENEGEDSSDASDVQRPLKKLKLDELKGKSKGKGKEAVATAVIEIGVPDSRKTAQDANVGASKENLDVKDKAGKYRTHYAVVRQKMGCLKPVHGEGQFKVHEILRVFDLSYEYGPCVGVNRLERWERAEALGLNPPREVRDILLTKQAVEQEEFSKCVFHQFEM